MAKGKVRYVLLPSDGMAVSAQNVQQKEFFQVLHTVSTSATRTRSLSAAKGTTPITVVAFDRRAKSKADRDGSRRPGRFSRAASVGPHRARGVLPSSRDAARSDDDDQGHAPTRGRKKSEGQIDEICRQSVGGHGSNIADGDFRQGRQRRGRRDGGGIRRLCQESRCPGHHRCERPGRLGAGREFEEDRARLHISGVRLLACSAEQRDAEERRRAEGAADRHRLRRLRALLLWSEQAGRRQRRDRGRDQSGGCHQAPGSDGAGGRNTVPGENPHDFGDNGGEGHGTHVAGIIAAQASHRLASPAWRRA